MSSISKKTKTMNFSILYINWSQYLINFQMKYTTYFLTFFAYVAVHMLRMGYSSIKADFSLSFGLDNTFLGLFDGLVYISLSLGYFFRYLIQGTTKKTTIYLIFGTVTALSYSIIPILGLLLKNDQGLIGDQSSFTQYGLPGIGLILFGFCQFTSYPVLLYFVNQHFNSGTLLGLWSSCGDFGNICGFFLGNLILNDLSLNWQYVMIIGASFHLFMSILVFTIIKDKKVQTDQLSSEQSLMEKNVIGRKEKFIQFLQFSKEVISLNQNKLYLLAFGLLKAVMYGVLLWMPTYLKHKGYKSQSTWAPIVFDVCTIIGSGILGYFYRDSKRVPRSEYQEMSSFSKMMHGLNKNIKSYCLFYSALIIQGSLVLFYVLPFGITQTFILNGVTGFFLGGAFNMLSTNEVVCLAKGDLTKVEMLSTLSMICGNFFAGVVTIIIGIALDVKTDQSKQSNLFIVLMAITAIACAVIFVRSSMIYKQRRKESILLQNQADQLENDV